MYKFIIKIFFLFISFISYHTVMKADTVVGENNEDKYFRYFTQFNATIGHGDNTPYWLSALRQGLVSPTENSGYTRFGLTYGNTFGDKKQYKYNVTADVTINKNNTNTLFIHQAFAELSWRWLTLSIGSKEHFSELKGDIGLFDDTGIGNNNINRLFPNMHLSNMATLSSGGLSYSGNSRPIPQIRLEIPKYIPFPGTKNWLHIRAHIAYGTFLDHNFQEKHTRPHPTAQYGKELLYHSKSCFIKIGKPEKFPLIFEGGVEMYSQFGGDIYNHRSGKIVSMPSTFMDYIKAFIPLSGSKDTPKDEQTNISGNQLGSWHAAITIPTKAMDIRLYGEHFFEDFSQLFFFEYQMDRHGDKNIIYYPWKDIMLGIKLTNKSNLLPFISSVQYEYLNTYDQSGALYHDPSDNFNEQMDGVDNYYNHGIYPGWHNWGMGIGNPLIISPIYNRDGDLKFKSNRLTAHNIGINGTMGKNTPLAYRLQYTYSENWGTYLYPFCEKKYTTSVLGELMIAPVNSNWLGCLSVGYDHSNHIGNNLGVMISISHIGSLLKTKK